MPAARAVKPRLVSDRDLASIHLTNPQREFALAGAGTGVTKLDVAIYYARVGDWLLPEVLRPLADFRLMVNGLIIVLAVLFMPRGILPWRIARTG